jgi:DNA-binding GntR family transcriptional regulator
MTPSQPAVSNTLGQQVSEALELQILSGALAPGQRLNADDLAESFGVSRIPVREALRSLNAAGWIEIRPRHGAFVRERSLQELDDLFHIRGILEAEAASLAAAHRTEEHLVAMAAAHDDLVAGNKSGDPVAAAEANSRFHRAVAEASGNTVLADVNEQLAKRIRWYFATVAEARAAHSAEEHAELLRAIRDEDAATASQLAREHVLRTSALVRDALRAELHDSVPEAAGDDAAVGS